MYTQQKISFMIRHSIYSIALVFLFMGLSAGQSNATKIYLVGHSYFIGMNTELNHMAINGDILAGASNPHVTGNQLKDQWINRAAYVIPALESGVYDRYFFGEWIANGGNLTDQQVAATILHATLFKELLSSYGKEMYLMIPWSFAAGFNGHTGYTCCEAGYNLLDSLYNLVADAVGITLVPVGEAFVRVKKLQPNIVLHSHDGSHLNATGKYLRNVVTYAYFLNKDPMPLSKMDISSADATLFKTVAWELIQDITITPLPLKNTIPPKINIQVVPNPMSSGNVRIMTPGALPFGILDIYDGNGKLVQEIMADGPASFHWDGTDKSGIQVNPGVYLYHIGSGKTNVYQGRIIKVD